VHWQLRKALVLLALTPDAYQQVWHLPVDRPISPAEVATLINKELGTNLKVSYISDWMMPLLTLFIPILKEVKEMKEVKEVKEVKDKKKIEKRNDAAMIPLEDEIIQRKKN
jgi:hypothetical protein